MTATDGDARCHNPVVALPAAGSTLSLDRVRVGMEVGVWWLREPCTLCPGPHLSFMVLCDGSPATTQRLGAPDQGADPRAQLTMVEINLTYVCSASSVFSLTYVHTYSGE